MSGRRPRQQRAVETHRRVYDAALNEYERVGLDAARVEDIVAAAGVGWGTFFRHFPRKEDVLVEAAADMARTFAVSARYGLERGDPVLRVIAGSIPRAGLAGLSERPALHAAILRELDAHPEHFAAYLAEQGQPSMIDTMTEILEEGQQRGEVRTDYPPQAIAQITMAAISAAHRQDVDLGRPAGTWHGRVQRHVMLVVELCAYGFAPRSNEEDEQASPNGASR